MVEKFPFGERGVAFVEFIVVFPFLFLFLLGAADLARLVSATRTLAFITEEIGNTASRDCKEHSHPIAMRHCLRNSAVAAMRYANGPNAALLGTGVTVRAYKVLPDTAINLAAATSGHGHSSSIHLRHILGANTSYFIATVGRIPAKAFTIETYYEFEPFLINRNVLLKDTSFHFSVER